MAGVVPRTADAAPDTAKADTIPLSITTAVNQDSPSSVSSPASAASLSYVSTPTSSGSTAPPIAVRPSGANKAPAVKGSSKTGSMAPSLIASSDSRPPPRTMSMTSREWVIPPRPKPGRKPATDTPPTKRKAQNRAAQRAFRERRAARVGELEEQLDEEKATHDRTVRELQERIGQLETETETLQSRCQWLESMLEKERQSRNSVTTSWDAQRRPSARNSVLASAQVPTEEPLTLAPMQPASARNVMARPMPVAEPRPLGQPFSISQIVSPPEEAAGTVDLGCGGCGASGSCACAEEILHSTDITMGCGNCSLGTRCECLEESLNVSIDAPDLKRPRPPSSPPSTSPEDKRQRSDAGMVMETDFTAMFSSQSHKEPALSTFPPPQLQPLASIEPRDACGFCKDGTYCVCADAMNPSAPPPASQPLLEQTQTHTPPPSDNEVIPLPMEVTATGAIKLPGVRSLQRRQQQQTSLSTKPPVKTGGGGGCGPNGPGTCAQCLADPKSGLFCRSLAANFEKNNPGSGSSGGCCGNGGPGGCCKSGQPAATSTSAPSVPALSSAVAVAIPAPTLPSFNLSLSCADAYKTLASHRHFDEAADDIGSWLPKLKALPVPRPSGRRAGGGGAGGVGGGGGPGRAPIEVEAASIMSVLKDFDVRFGRGE